MSNNKIGFFPSEEKATLKKGPPQSEDALIEILEQLRNPPDWLGAYEQTLFWAVVFNTQDKRHDA